MPSVVLTRDSGYADRIRKYQVLIDGNKVGDIGNGGAFKVSVEPGQHTIQVKIDWARTEVTPFTSEQGEVNFHVRSNMRGWKILLASIYVFMPSKWISLERA